MTTQTKIASSTDKVVAPYIPFKTFQTAIETLEQGVPPQLDRSVWKTWSGAVQSQTLSGFRFLGLIDSNGNTQPSLNKLVEAREDSARRAVLKTIIEERYAKLIPMAEQDVTSKQLEDTLREYGVQGSTLDKAVRFFISAANYAGVRLSVHWAKANGRGTANRTSRQRIPREPDGESAPPSRRGRQRNNPPAGRNPEPGYVKTVSLPGSVGTVTLSVSINPIELIGPHRTWFYEGVDWLNKCPSE